MNKSLQELEEMDRRILAARKSLETPHHDFSSGFTASLLAQAIQDAKTVRLTALAHARQALQDAFEEHNIW